jgi:hypothetical protein
MRLLLCTLTSRKCAFALLLLLSVFASGCTSELWDQKTFAHHYQPADPNNLRLFYSLKRQDILVQYDELKDPENTIRTRSYWLGQNMLRENPDAEPHFVSAKKSRGLTPVPISEAPPTNTFSDSLKFYAVARHGDDFFTLYSGDGAPDPYQLPKYKDPTQKVKQIALTPLTVGVDATVFGTICGVCACYYALPQILMSLNR